MPPKNREPALPSDPQTTPSSPQSPHLPAPSFLRRLSTTVPEHTSHIIDRLLSPNKIQFSLPHNDPHDPQSPPAAPAVPHTPAKKQRRVSFSIGAWKEKQAKVMESEVAALEEGREGSGAVEDGEGEFGVPLCREAEIEKWKIGRVGERRKRRTSWH